MGTPNHRFLVALKRPSGLWITLSSHGRSGTPNTQHLQSYLDEFVFRFNRRYSPKAAFRSLLSIGTKTSPITYDILINPDAQG